MACLIGRTFPELGGSEIQYLYSKISGKPPLSRFSEEKKACELLRYLNTKGLVKASHDVSVGGIAVSIFEMTMELGVNLKINGICKCNPHEVLFSESGARYIIATEDYENVLKIAKEHGVPAYLLGKVGGGVYSIEDIGVRLDARDLTRRYREAVVRGVGFEPTQAYAIGS